MPGTYRDPAFHRLLRNLIVVPPLLMAGIAAVLLWQISRLVADADRVNQSDVVVGRAYELKNLTIDMETGLRGFLVTGVDRFLQPYDEAIGGTPTHPPIAVEATTLRDLVAADADQAASVADLDRRRAAWVGYAAEQIRRRRTGGDYVGGVADGKRRMDEMRAVFDHVIARETALRRSRSAAVRTATRATLVSIAAVLLAGGGLLAGLARRMFLDVTARFGLAIGTARKLNADLERRVAERTRELADQTARLAEANGELEAFGYSVSHDLRAPMRHISGFAELLRASAGRQLSPDDAENLDTIATTAKLAGRMVDDLLNFSRVGRAAIELVPVDLNPVLADCRRAVEPDARGRPITWNVGPLPTVLADPAMTRMVVRNLLANAVKYTAGRDPAVIDVAAAPAADDGAVAFLVRDNGVGFDMAYAHKLFGVFQRLHRAEDFEGTGIGLANVRRIVTRMGGKAWADGEVGKGATFHVQLPPAGRPTAAAIGGDATPTADGGPTSVPA